MSKHFCLKKPCPILVQGLIRVGGGLQRSPFFLNVKHLIILPKNHHVTHLIINFFHQKEGHSGVQHTLAATRTQFWVINGHATVRKVLNECRICRLKYPARGSQIMAPLPVHRITPGIPAYTCIGVDYAGSFFIKAGHTTLKRYLCVFTCLATRAVHLEPSFLSSNLSAVYKLSWHITNNIFGQRLQFRWRGEGASRRLQTTRQTSHMRSIESAIHQVALQSSGRESSMRSVGERHSQRSQNHVGSYRSATSAYR